MSNLKGLLKKYQISSSKLQIEVLETGLMKNIQSAQRVLNDLIVLGIKVALDDFGTGYSSLTYLRRLPISILKIDQGFIQGMINDKDDEVIVKAIIAMSRDLDVRLLAEGIETKEQLDVLKKIGCEMGQGYYFGKPMSAYDFENRFLIRDDFFGVN